MMIKQLFMALGLMCCSILFPGAVVAQEIVAHRGASYLAPENTLASVKLGYVLGADAVEVDVHLSADKRIMVIHDKDTKRTAGGEKLLIAEIPSEELRKLEVGSWKDEKFRGEKYPSWKRCWRKCLQAGNW